MPIPGKKIIIDIKKVNCEKCKDTGFYELKYFVMVGLTPLQQSTKRKCNLCNPNKNY